MKKLMIMTVVAMAASFGFGAATTWGVEWAYADITGFNNYEDGSANGSYWFVALAANDTSAISVDKTGSLTVGASDTIVKTGAITEMLGGSGTLAGVSANQYVALVIYDSDAKSGDYVGAYGIAVQQVSSDASDDPPVTGGLPGYGEMAANIGILGTSGGVPEPTSGLLLVLGGAMLALRRRRA